MINPRLKTCPRITQPVVGCVNEIPARFIEGVQQFKSIVFVDLTRFAVPIVPDARTA